MRIERVDDKTVKCFLSNEELEEYEIDYRDFILRSEKAREVVQEIMEQAEEEVGYKPPKFAFDLQIMMMPEQGLLLTFSERDPADFKSGEQILECLRDVKKMLERSKERQDDTPPKKGAVSKQMPTGNVRPEEAVFAFSSIGAVMEYAAVMPANLRVQSALYRMEDMYYLQLQKGGASYERYSRACVQALEFSGLYTAEEDRLLYLKEHGECLIAEHAFKKLRGKK